MPARTAIMEITTSSSMRVNAREDFVFMRVSRRENGGLGRGGGNRMSRVRQLERHSRQRRQADHERVRPALPREFLRFEAAHVADVATAVGPGIGVNDLAVETGS